MDENEKLIAELRLEVEGLKGKLKDANNEAKGHRLSSEQFRKEVEEWRSKYTTAAEALTAAETKHKEDLEKLKLDTTAKVKDADSKAAAAKSDADKRVMMSELKLEASTKGILDTEYLKLLDLSTVKVDDAGNVTNAAEVIDGLKTAKPHMFGEAAKPGTQTGNTTKPGATAPAAKPGDSKFNAMTATKEEFDKAVRDLTRVK